VIAIRAVVIDVFSTQPGFDVGSGVVSVPLLSVGLFDLLQLKIFSSKTDRMHTNANRIEERLTCGLNIIHKDFNPNQKPVTIFLFFGIPPVSRFLRLNTVKNGQI
jgi:hypothetical protein